MKAIDFACNLLKTLSECELSTADIRVLFCIAAGLHYKEEMCGFLTDGVNTGHISSTLKRLETRRLVHNLDRKTELFKLTDKGKEIISNLLRFLPHNRH